MAGYCNMCPRVKDKNGNEADSIFFNDLMEFVGDRAMAKELYARFNDPDLKKNNPKLKLDKYGEPVLESIFENRMDILECIVDKGGEDFLRKSLLNRLNNPSYREDNIYNSEDAARSVKEEFEKNSKYSKYFSLTIERAADGKFSIGFEKQNLMPYEKKIADAISSFINENGLSQSVEEYIRRLLNSGSISARELAEAILNRRNKGKTLSNNVVSKMLLYGLDNNRLYSLIDKMNKRLPDNRKVDVNKLSMDDWDGVLGQLVDYINANAVRMRPIIDKLNDVFFSHESQKNLRDAIAKIDEQNKPDKVVEETKKEQGRKRRKLNINSKSLSSVGKFYHEALERLQSEYYEIIGGLESAVEGKDFAEKARIYVTTKESLLNIYDELTYYLDVIKGEDDFDISDDNIDKIRTELDALQNRVAKMSVSDDITITDLMQENFNDYIRSSIEEDRKNFHLSDSDVDLIEAGIDEKVGWFAAHLIRPTLLRNSIIQYSARLIKERQTRVRNKCEEMHNKITRLIKYSHDLGIRNFNFMYELDSNGKRTGNYVSKIDYAAFYAAREANIISLAKSIGVNDKNISKAQKRGKLLNLLDDKTMMLYYNWMSQNTVKKDDGRIIPNEELYKSRSFDSLTKEQRDFYEQFMEMRNDLVRQLPVMVYKGVGGIDEVYRAIQISSDFVNRVKQNGWIKAYKMPIVLLRCIREKFIERVDDEYNSLYEFKQEKKEKGKRLSHVAMNCSALFYTARLHNSDYLTEDVCSALMSFASSVYYYNEMEGILDLLEEGEKKLPEDKNTQLAYKSLLKTQIYNIPNDEIVNINKITFRKIANLISSGASLTYLGLNWKAASSASLHDLTQIIGEANAGENFTEANLIEAFMTIFGPKGVVPGMIDLGANDKIIKLSLFARHFNIRGNVQREYAYNRMGRRRLAKALDGNIFYIFMNASSGLSDYVVSLATAMHENNIIDKNGKRINVWEAYEVVKEVDENGNTSHTLKLKDGCKNVDGSEITESDETRWSNRWRAISENLFGVYTKEDAAIANNTAIGQLILMFRKYLISSIDRRYHARRYDSMEGRVTEGFIVTPVRMIAELVSGTRRAAVLARGGAFKKHERANLARFVTEMGFIVLCSMLGRMIFQPPKDEYKEKKKKWEDEKKYRELSFEYDEYGARLDEELLSADGPEALPWAFKMMDKLNKRLIQELMTPTFSLTSEADGFLSNVSVVVSYLQSWLVVLFDLGFIPGDLLRMCGLSNKKENELNGQYFSDYEIDAMYKDALRGYKVIPTGKYDEFGKEIYTSSLSKKESNIIELYSSLATSSNRVIGSGGLVKSGKYRGKSKLSTHVKKVTPFIRQWETLMNPDDINTDYHTRSLLDWFSGE